MTITIVTLYRAHSCEHLVGAVKGTISPKQRRSLAQGYLGQQCGWSPSSSKDEDSLSFAEAEVIDNPSELHEFVNIDQDGFWHVCRKDPA